MAEFFPVPLPYPRTLDTKTSPTFGALTKRVYELLGMQ
jgi:NitT/TauT family transport system ATP-binding protein